MKREIDEIFYLGEKIDFTELVYYEGPKLSVNVDKKFILAWHKEIENFELWFLIKADSKIFNKYIKNQITLLDAIQNSYLEIVKRPFDEYDTIQIEQKEPQLDLLNLPGKASFLGFNYAEEINPYSSFSKIDSIASFSEREFVISSQEKNIKLDWGQYMASANVSISYQVESFKPRSSNSAAA
jgi:hypothetical protein